jgi:hypothetical protein
MNISYPDHPFCQILTTGVSAGQLREKLTSLEPVLPALLTDPGKAWLKEPFENRRKFETDREPGTETEIMAVKILTLYISRKNR